MDLIFQRLIGSGGEILYSAEQNSKPYCSIPASKASIIFIVKNNAVIMMKYYFVLLLLPFFAMRQTMAQDTLLLKESIQKWKNASEYTIELAKAMPPENYDFRPVERMMTFSEQLLHTGKNMVWLSSKFLTRERFDHPLAGKESCTPEEAVQLLMASLAFAQNALEKLPSDSLNIVVDFFAGPMTKRQIISLMHDHHTHHRGQLIVYLNLKGIEPPKYRGW